MKRLLAVVMILALAVGFAACTGSDAPQSTPAPTVPTTEEPIVPTTVPATDSIVGGIDLSGLTLEQAAQALTEASAVYELNLTVNGRQLAIAAGEMGLALDENALGAYLSALDSGAELPEAIFTYDAEALVTILGERLNVAPQNVTISFDSDAKRFAAEGGAEGTEYDLAAAAEGAAASIGLLQAMICMSTYL